MGLFIQRDEKRSELQEQIAAQLQEKNRAREQAKGERPDGVDDAAFLKSTKQTTSLAGVWLVLALIAAAILIFFIISTT